MPIGNHILEVLHIVILPYYLLIYVQVAGIVRLHSEHHADNEDDGEDLDLPLFTFKTVTDATNDFSIDSKLGEGGFGPVYKVIVAHHALVQNIRRNCCIEV